jgi:hypothetical protein
MAAKKSVKKIQEEKEQKTFQGELISQMLTLATSGFGLVAALAWNETIQSLVKEYIQPRIPGSGIISNLLYALLITALAVFITYQLSKLSARFQHKK